jgi:nicotinamidase-related amidase
MDRITRKNAALCLIDHQLGLVSAVRDISVAELKNNVVALAKAFQVLGVPVVVATTAKNELWGPTIPELVDALKEPYATVDRMTVNAWDEPAFVKAVEATKRTHLVFAGITLQICAAFPAYSAIAANYQSYVVVDASSAFSQTQRQTGLLRMAQQGVVLTDYFTISAEIMASNADPLSKAVYAALNLDFAVLVEQIATADRKRVA